MRFPASIIAFILGLLLAGLGVGLLTVWSSDEVPTAQSQEVDEAPLTVISDDLIDVEAGREEFTVDAEGEFTIALARTQDIEAWVGDAAHVRIGQVQEGQDDAEATIETEFIEGEATVPDPADSDLWVASETTEGDLRYGWSAPDDSGDWSLLMFRDGEEPAPSSVSVELEEDPDTVLGTVLIVLGALIILLGVFLLLRSRKTARHEQAEPTRRRAAAPVSSAAASATASAGTVGAAQDSSEHRAQERGAAGHNRPEHGATVVNSTDADLTHGQDAHSQADLTEDEMTADQRSEDPADDELTGVLGSISSTESTYTPEALEDEDPESTGTIEPVDPEASDTSETPDSDDTGDADGQQRSWRSRSVATAAALAVALSPAVVLADAQEEPDAEESSQSDPAEGDAAEGDDAAGDETEGDEVEAEEVDPEEGADSGYSVLLESQLQSIIDDIAERTEEADAEFDAELLAPRVSGNAETVRELTYRNHELDEDVMPDPIGTEILSAAVTSGTEFPRQAVVITQEAEAEIPQVLVIEQASARENYELTQAVLMVPGTEFPAISAEDGGVESIEPTDDEALFAANHAMERVAVFLNNSEYYFGMHVEENAYIEDLQSYQDELRESAEDLEISYTRPLIGEGSTAMRLPDGSVLAVGSFDSTTQLRPEDGASINLSGVSAELAETESTTADTDIINRESMILHIPAEEGEQVVVLGVHDIVNEVNILD
ncbi:DUF2561 family protein [Nesterenkonia lutea]|uniref:Uncharacterized protein n=1 Tax=Nesterenkonia lutea TaxID=272919 RepID=A0ABR9JCY9_9MICC|nr:DUF2561 family protein [Nesterenkonia lutea]MBE1523648.1 hypothetical protein [Nesterenkonia lutea]